MDNIFLVGMMGSGKSVTGKKLAEMLGYSFVDLDERIQQKNGRTITDIFQKEGENYFRDLESKVLEETAASKKQVVATGGGAVLRPGNVLSMQKSGKVIFLETSLNVLWERVKNKKDRPLLKGQDPFENLKKIFSERAETYKKSAELSVNTDGLTAEQAAKKVLEQLRNIENDPG